MVLAQPPATLENIGGFHPFSYAHILGIFHVNAIYIGPGMVDYTPRQLDFLWVRWYQHDRHGRDPTGWDSYLLDQISFPPMALSSSFGFIDPADVLRGCHIIPNFAKGKRYNDGVGLSQCASDSEDWHSYYVGR